MGPDYKRLCCNEPANSATKKIGESPLFQSDHVGMVSVAASRGGSLARLLMSESIGI